MAASEQATPGGRAARVRRAEDSFERLKKLLREILELDRGDLDFGLYRVMNRKADEINAFLDHDLLPQVREFVAGASEEERALVEAELARALKTLRELGVPVEDSETVRKLRARLAAARADSEAETDVYNHLATFFGRYYHEGDFMTLRRYSSGGRPTYLIPYDGEEVRLHWANADQYYIKTTENYASYAFLIGSEEPARRVCFDVVAADNERDDIKEANGRQRRFVLAKDESAIHLDGDHLIVRFEHRPLTDAEKNRWKSNGIHQQHQIDKEAVARILDSAKRLVPDWIPSLSASVPTDADPERVLLAKHVARYTAKNSFDYFIHKDLGGFLRRELDMYLKTDVLNVDDLSMSDDDQLRQTLARMRAVRHIGGKIIDLLTLIEGFQKRLWLKKKFVLETQWCVTLDRVPIELYSEIAANDAQREEWVELFAIDEEATSDPSSGGAGYSEPLSVAFLRSHQSLALDTRHFDGDFKDRLLAALSESGSLDERTDGLLVHGENFQALNLLRKRYAKQVRCVYIDPPYNAQSSEILYKNSYRDSTWLSFVENRMAKARSFESDRAVVVVAIDEVEQEYLGCLLRSVFHDRAKTCVTVVHNATGQQGNNFSSTHEYAYFLYSRDERSIGLQKREKPDIRPFRDVSKGSHLRGDAANCFYPVFLRDGEIAGFGDVCPDDFHPASRNVVRDDGVIEVYPIDASGTERKWVFARQSVEDIKAELFPKQDAKSGEWDILRKKERFNYKTVWTGARYSANSWGSRILNEVLGDNDFTFPKSIYTVRDCVDASLRCERSGIVLDYFAGSGTTGHAVINLNREDGGHRKYILVEMGDHFDTVMLPRLKKIVYAPDWKGGKPLSRGEGVSQLIKYVRLESYEDTLDGLVVIPPKEDLLAKLEPKLAEDYRLRYALGAETARSACLLGKNFVNPFSYKLSIARDGARRETSVDLPETFNFLLGLRVEFRRRIDGVLAIAGEDPLGQRCLVLWRNLETTDNDALERWLVDNRARVLDSPDVIYTNGDHTLRAVRQAGETWTAESIEPLFRAWMFDSNERDAAEAERSALS